MGYKAGPPNTEDLCRSAASSLPSWAASSSLCFLEILRSFEDLENDDFHRALWLRIGSDATRPGGGCSGGLSKSHAGGHC
jgi:hypothetical protein